MSFIFYDLAILVAFCIFIVLFLYVRRKNVKREGALFLYRTKAGLKTIDSLNKKLSKLWKILGPVIIFFGFVFMILIIVLLIQSISFTFTNPTKVPPVMPLVPYLPQAFDMPMPPFYFTYWILIIAIIAVTHEFAHGIYARRNRINVKSTGFGFLGPFLLAFVEPDEKQMAKKPKKAQMEILAAGSFSNFVFAIIFVLLMQLFFVCAYQPAGIAYSLAYDGINTSQIKSIGDFSNDAFFNMSDKELKAINETLELKTENKSYWLTPDLIKEIPYLRKTIEKNHLIAAYEDSPAFNANLSGGILEIDGVKIKSQEQASEILAASVPWQSMNIKTASGEYEITLGENELNSSKGYLGIGFVSSGRGIRGFLAKSTSPFFSEDIFVKPRINPYVATFFSDLFVWLILICFFVAIFNMLPVGFLDGGKFFYLSALIAMKSKKKAEIAFKIMSYIVGAIFLLLILAWLFA